jgi:hypothetical protein
MARQIMATLLRRSWRHAMVHKPSGDAEAGTILGSAKLVFI